MIVLNMIVKNEAHCIERCLRSVIPYVTHAVIVDTGSTDGTPELIEKLLPPEMYRNVLRHAWKNFGQNRTDAIRAARVFSGGKGHAFIIDADEEFRPEPGFQMPANQLRRTAFTVWQTTKDGRYLRPQLLSLYHDWRFEGVVHEYAKCDDLPQLYILPNCTTHGYFDSARNKQGIVKKCLADADLLKSSQRTLRNVFYIAESYRGAKDLKKAFYWYTQRLQMEGGWEEERWWCAYMMACCSAEVGDRPGVVIDLFKRAIEMRPSRSEAYIDLARYLWTHDRKDESRAIFKEAWKIPMTTDSLNVRPDYYNNRLG